MFSKLEKVAIVATLIAIGATVTPSPAQALPPPGDYLIVNAYYADAEHNHVIGQTWTGCGQPAGRWGTTSGPYRELFFTPCS